MITLNGAEVTKSSNDEITCEYGEYPYCPLCKYGCEVTEEWMPEDMCEWHCYHPNNPKPGNIRE